MKNFHFARFLVVVEQSRNFNYATSPRTTTQIDFARCVPSVRSHTTTLDAIQRQITSRLSQYLPDESARFLVWLLDSDNNPTLFVTGLLDVRQGKLNREQLAEWSDALLPQITCEQTMIEVEVTVSATAELLFTEGHDYNLADYEGEGQLRDEEVAEEMVSKWCGHLEQSDATLVGRVEDCLMVDAHITETVTIEVPWQTFNVLEAAQLAFMIEQATDELMSIVDIASRFVNVCIESFSVLETQAA